MEPIQIRIYSKKDCHLCDEAKSILSTYARQYPMSIEEVDIEQDPAAWEAYQSEIPVVFFKGRKLFKYRIDPEKLEREILKTLGMQSSHKL